MWTKGILACVLAGAASASISATSSDSYKLILKNNSSELTWLESAFISVDSECKDALPAGSSELKAGQAAEFVCERMKGSSLCIRHWTIRQPVSPWLKLQCNDSPAEGVLELNIFGR